MGFGSTNSSRTRGITHVRSEVVKGEGVTRDYLLMNGKVKRLDPAHKDRSPL